MKLYFVISIFTVLNIINSNTNSNTNSNANSINYLSGRATADSLSDCPVTGDKITTAEIQLRYIDKVIVFCNEGCLMAFKKEPAKFTSHLLCMPCNDADGKKEINAVYNGIKYYFCGKGCKKKFDADAEKYIEKFKEIRNDK